MHFWEAETKNQCFHLNGKRFRPPSWISNGHNLAAALTISRKLNNNRNSILVVMPALLAVGKGWVD